MSPVVVYTSNTCVNCDNLKKALKSKNIGYQEINVHDKPEEATMLKAKGFRSLPVINDNGEWMNGFTMTNFNKIVHAHSLAA